jgi:hypothetical protein
MSKYLFIHLEVITSAFFINGYTKKDITCKAINTLILMMDQLFAIN